MPTLDPHNRAELREWLMANAAIEKEVWVHCIRKEHPTIVSYLDVVEEALCVGWIDSTTRSYAGEGYWQRLSPRKAKSQWTELNKERCRRLIRLGLMTPAGRKVLPSLAKHSFVAEPWVVEAIKADPLAWKHHCKFPSLYVRVRLYNIQWTAKHVSEQRGRQQLDKYIAAARDGKMIGEWNDKGRLG